MANKAISELPQAQNVNNQDLFVLEQSGIAKKLTAETFITEQGIIDALAEALDGHGGIQSVTLASVSGRIRTYRITFSDGSATTFQVYDGTSIDRISRTSSSGLDDVYTVFLSDGTTTFFTVHNGADGNVSEAMLNDALKDKAPAITETTESSAIANFTDGADNMVMHNVVAKINPVQDLSNGDPSPSNICPITGWTGCNVTRTGKNLWDESDLLNCNGWAVSGGVYTGGSVSLISEYGLASGGVPVTFKENTQYTISLYGSATASANRFWVFFLYTDGTRSSVEFNTTSLIKKSLASTSGKSIRTMYFSRDTSGDVSIKEFQLELGSTATAYEPYQSETVTVDWTSEAGTVYGGTIDVATGLLTVDRVLHTVTSNDTTTLFGTGTNANRVGIRVTDSQLSANTTDRLKITSNMATASTNILSSNGYALGLCLMYSGGTDTYSTALFGVPTTCTTKELALDYLVNAGCTFLYYLATPQTYQLTPQEVKTLLGTNNVWADTGNVSVTYPADTKMFIEKLTMPTEDDLVANQAITSGKYFMIGNSLYLALANIASGAQITIGTNAQRVSLADALNTINS